MSQRLEKAQFRALSKSGKLVFHNFTDLERYCLENEGQEIMVSCMVVSEKRTKDRMLAFLYGPIAYVAARGYRRQGWQFVDDVVAIYRLQAELAKEWITNSITGETDVALQSISSMTKQQLHQFISDSLMFIEDYLEEEVPDADEYKISKLTNRNYKTL